MAKKKPWKDPKPNPLIETAINSGGRAAMEQCGFEYPKSSEEMIACQTGAHEAAFQAVMLIFASGKEPDVSEEIGKRNRSGRRRKSKLHAAANKKRRRR